MVMYLCSILFARCSRCVCFCFVFFR